MTIASCESGDFMRANGEYEQVSHQLRMLKQVRLVKTRRDGKVRYYSLADEHIQKMFQVAFEHIMED